MGIRQLVVELGSTDRGRRNSLKAPAVAVAMAAVAAAAAAVVEALSLMKD
jgi:hypothetical protein